MKPVIPVGRPLVQFGTWTLYEVPAGPGTSILWCRLKIMQPPETRRRVGRPRVYWVMWNPLETRLARGGGEGKLKALEPDLCDQVVTWLTDHVGREWLDAYTEAEIKAEIKRLAARRAAWQRMTPAEKAEAKRAAAEARAAARKAAR